MHVHLLQKQIYFKTSIGFNSVSTYDWKIVFFHGMKCIKILFALCTKKYKGHFNDIYLEQVNLGSFFSSFFPLPIKICILYSGLWYILVNAWIVNNLSLVNNFGETGRLFYNINYMLNSKHLSLVNKIGDKTEFTITRVHCI